ncbi:MAG: cysteine desulfurase family protein [Oscillospiraceae bacterium]
MKKRKILMIYLDNSATTKPSKIAIDAVNEILNNGWANPSSLYDIGFFSQKQLDLDRQTISEILRCDKNEIFFTSGGTESNNLAILGSAYRNKANGNKIVTTSFEHKSVLDTFKKLEKQGFNVVYINPDLNGDIDINEILQNIDNETILLSVMMLNNEIGTILPVFEIAKQVKIKNKNTIVHTDCVQSFCKLDINLKNSGIDLLSFSGHKIFAPKGVGGLYIKKGVKISELFTGGVQEKGLRAGTENTAFIHAMAQTGKHYYENIIKNNQKIDSLKDYLIKKIEPFNDIQLNLPKHHSGYVNNIWVKGIKSEVLLHYLEEFEVYVSSGSACGRGERSHVLSKLLDGKAKAEQSIRVSFSVDNTFEDIDILINNMKNALKVITKIR